ncbi:hypothetical protein VTJ83DRAFT_3501 [Remersonia thermophila]|uniref:N-acetyltransferase domain-containing protein n=1 Tax=Remersonia thermophila TaxID=72144 RepID=A0ABR4DE57_9PEZI
MLSHAGAVLHGPDMDPKAQPAVTLIQDAQSLMPLSSHLKDEDAILLLTPALVPHVSPLNQDPHAPTSDPFEPLGRALAKHHPRVRHVPYVPRNGITETHVVHIRLAAAVVFVISGPPCYGQPSQVGLAEITKSLSDQRPHVVVTCCEMQDVGALDTTFSTVIEAPGFAPSTMEAVADVLFGNPPAAPDPSAHVLLPPPQPWRIEPWHPDRDVDGIVELWRECFPKQFHLARYQMQSVLRRDGYAMHYVVRDSGAAGIVGFCATYTTYADRDGERLLGSLAALVVRSSHRRRGIGLSLHDHALRQLSRTRGVCRLQLGSTFPRLLCGLPRGSPAEGWFRRRGWPMHPFSSAPGAGHDVADWLLRFKDWPVAAPAPLNLSFRPCEFHEFDRVLDFVDRESRRAGHMGWYDQYAKLAGSMNVRDIILGLEGDAIIAAALTYCRNTGSPAAEDLPWAATLGEHVGGVTCICVGDEVPSGAHRRDAIMIRLLDSCIRLLADQGMKSMLVDAMKGGEEGFQSMGFHIWARYRDVWRNA